MAEILTVSVKVPESKDQENTDAFPSFSPNDNAPALFLNFLVRISKFPFIQPLKKLTFFDKTNKNTVNI